MAAGAGYTRIRSARRRASAWNGWSGARAGGIRLVRLEIGGPAGVRARWLASWCYGRSTGGVRMSKEREWRCRCRCRCSARCQTQTSVTRLAVACPGPAQLLGGADVGVAQHLAWSATRQQQQQQQRGVDSAPVAGTRLDLTECGWAETATAMAGNSLTGPYKAWERFRRRSQHSRRDPPEIHTGRDGAAGDWTACVRQTEHFTALACNAHCRRAAGC